MENRIRFRILCMIVLIGLAALASVVQQARQRGHRAGDGAPMVRTNLPVLTQANTHQWPEKSTGPSGQAGRRVHIDPTTGRIGAGPPSVPAIAAGGANALSTSGEGLPETPGTTRGGGIKIDVQGRFRNVVVATLGQDGKLTTRCLSEADPAVKAKDAFSAEDLLDNNSTH